MTQSNTEFYVYIHLRKDNGEPFYVGKGTGRRYKNISARNIYWKRVYRKYGRIAIIVERSTDEQYIFKKEVEWYEALKPFYKLTNLTTCGSGGSKWINSMSDEAKQKISIANIGEKNSNFGGICCTEEWSKSQRKSQTRYKYKLTNSYTGEILIFNSFYEAGEYFGDGKIGYQIRNFSYSQHRFRRIWYVEKIKINSNDTI